VLDDCPTFGIGRVDFEIDEQGQPFWNKADDFNELLQIFEKLTTCDSPQTFRWQSYTMTDVKPIEPALRCNQAFAAHQI
jgi:hypothetical protein